MTRRPMLETSVGHAKVVTVSDRVGLVTIVADPHSDTPARVFPLVVDGWPAIDEELFLAEWHRDTCRAVRRGQLNMLLAARTFLMEGGRRVLRRNSG